MTTLGSLFFQGMANGLVAFAMPCIFPLLPLTISFFTKNSQSRWGAISKALVYGLSIILIYCALGGLITALLGPSALNELASSAWFNLAIFFLLVVFAISFLGAFDINLPSGLVNKIDGFSGTQTYLGIFFMAFTLALVSFSCTGPIIGTLLVSSVKTGQYYGLVASMLGFSLALSLPFTLAAIFPSFMTRLPKSGAWLNSVKVFLGFIELAASLKFLSSFDLTYHIGMLNREVFLSLWIIIFTLLGFYLMGKIKFSHDSDVTHLSVFRFFIALCTFSFVVYMVPGLWGAPLKSLSGFLPPLSTQEFVIGHDPAPAGQDLVPRLPSNRKLATLLREPPGFQGFYDFNEGLAYAKTVKKPILLDFTGHSCVNCRKMEESVWADPRIKALINQQFVLISLYVDEKIELPLNEQYTSTITQSRVKTIGNYNSDLQARLFGTNSQPYYVLLDNTGKALLPATAFNLDIPAYTRFLEDGLLKYNHQRR